MTTKRLTIYTMNEKVGLLGSGGQSAETESYLGSDTVKFRAIDKAYISRSNDIDIVNPTEDERIIPVVAAVGAPALRRELVEKWPGKNFTKVISKEAYIGKDTLIGDGTTIAPKVVITTAVKIGRHVIINIAATLSHGVELGDYVTISPGAHIAGDVTIGDGVFVGIGAIVSNGVEIAEGSVIGAGAVVINDILDNNSVVVGIPAKVIKLNEDWLRNV